MLRTETKHIVVHVTATPPSADIGVKEVRAMHKAQGWSDIGYHYIIRRNGKVEPGRAPNDVGSHVKGFNSVSLGVSMVGGVNARGLPESNATPEQMVSLERLLRDLQMAYPKATICGHRDLSPDLDGDGIIEPGEWIKACPCFDVIPWARQKGLKAASIRGAWDNESTIAPKAPDAKPIEIQRYLVTAGYAIGPIDGIIGPRTEKAILQFQTMQGLERTGQPDPKTVARLKMMFGK